MQREEKEDEMKCKLSDHNYDMWRQQTETNTGTLLLVHTWIRNRVKPLYAIPPLELPVLDNAGVPRMYANDHADLRIRGQPMMTVDPRFTPTEVEIGMVLLLQRPNTQNNIEKQYNKFIELMVRNRVQLESEAASFCKEIRSTCSRPTWAIMESAPTSRPT